MSALVEVHEVHASYSSGAQALRGVSLSVSAGERVSVIGPNGAGKTTLTRVLTGSLRAYRGRVTRGTIIFDGKDIRRMSSGDLIRAGISHVPEGRGMLATLTVEDNLRVSIAALPRRRRPSLLKVLQTFPVLVERRKTLAGLLSGGQQQMVAIARALSTSPRLLIADELSLGLAPLTTQELVAGLRVRSVEEGTAVLLVEQSAAIALKFSDETYILEGGRVAVRGDSRELLAQGTAHNVYLGKAVEGGEHVG